MTAALAAHASAQFPAAWVISRREAPSPASATAESRVPTVATAQTSWTTLTTGRPKVVSTPGEGRPGISSLGQPPPNHIARTSTANAATPTSRNTAERRRGEVIRLLPRLRTALCAVDRL